MESFLTRKGGPRNHGIVYVPIAYKLPESIKKMPFAYEMC